MTLEIQVQIPFLTDLEWELNVIFYTCELASILRWLFCHWESIKYLNKFEDCKQVTGLLFCQVVMLLIWVPILLSSLH